LASQKTDQALAQQIEGRQESQLPPIRSVADLTRLNTYQQISKFLGDQIGYRILLGRWLNTLNHALFRQSRFGTIDVGSQGWLFYLPSYSGQPPWTLPSIQSALTQLQQFLSWSHRQGLTTRVVLIPEKQELYPEHLPALGRLTVQAYAPLTQAFGQGYARLAGDRPEVLDYAEVLGQAKSSSSPTLLYNPVDSHYTPYAALLLARTLLQSLHPPVWNNQDIRVQGSQTAKGDLLRILNLNPDAQLIQSLQDRAYSLQRPCVQPQEITANQRRFTSYAAFQQYIRDDAQPWTLATIRSRTTDPSRCPLIPGKTLLVGDSAIRYYLAGSLPQYFEQLTLAHWDAFPTSAQFRQQLGQYNTVILQSVNRLAVDRFNHLLNDFSLPQQPSSPS
jgi:hypothetical protein